MEGNDFTAHLTLGAVAVYALEYVKSAGWCPWITQDTKALNRLLSVAMAIISAMGISISYNPSLGGTIQIPALSVLLLGVWEVVKQTATQQLIYDGITGKAKP